MADAPGTSFIPQKRNAPKAAPIRRKRFYIFNFIATVVFVVTTVLTAGTFFYKDYSEARLVEQKEALTEQRNIFSESDIASVQDLDNRIRAAEEQLESHVSILKLLEAIEQTTPVSVQYKSFSYVRQPDGGSVVLLQGVTDDFDSVIGQKQSLQDSEVLNRSLVADVKYATGQESTTDEDTEVSSSDDENAIRFSLAISVPEDEIRYTVGETTATETTIVEVSGELTDTVPTEDDAVADETLQPNTPLDLEANDQDVSL